MQGEYEYEYCLIPFDNDFDEALSNGYDFSYPKLFAIQEARHDGKDKLVGINIETQGTLLLSAVKKAEEGNAVVVRMYNPLENTAHILSKQAFAKTNLAEKADEDTVNNYDVAAKKIATLKFQIQ